MRTRDGMAATGMVSSDHSGFAAGDDHERTVAHAIRVIPTNTAVRKAMSSGQNLAAAGDDQQARVAQKHAVIPTNMAAISTVPSGHTSGAAGDDHTGPVTHRDCVIPTNKAANISVSSDHIYTAAGEDVTVLPHNTLASPLLSSDLLGDASDGGSDASAPTRRKAVRRARSSSATNMILPDAINPADQSEPVTPGRSVSSGSGHSDNGNQIEVAAPNQSAGQNVSDIQCTDASAGMDHSADDAQKICVHPQTIAVIMSLHREHRALQRAVGDMDRRIKSEERWFAVRRCREEGIELKDSRFPPVTTADKMMVVATRERFFLARDAIEVQRKACQKELIKAAKSLPIAAWVGTVKGLGIASVAAVVGETGDFAGYQTVAQIWKRMGLAVIGGRAQGKRSNAEEALLHGYNPRRRSEMHVIGDCLVRAGGPYADLYRERKEYELAREGITKMHAHKRALRYIEKRLLREMWSAWREANKDLSSKGSMPPAVSMKEAA